MTDRLHICTCGDCAVDRFIDTCQFEARAAEMAKEVEEANRVDRQAPTVSSAIDYILHGGPKP